MSPINHRDQNSKFSLGGMKNLKSIQVNEDIDEFGDPMAKATVFE